jgi:hypothetical protein
LTLIVATTVLLDCYKCDQLHVGDLRYLHSLWAAAKAQTPPSWSWTDTQLVTDVGTLLRDLLFMYIRDKAQS